LKIKILNGFFSGVNLILRFFTTVCAKKTKKNKKVKMKHSNEINTEGFAIINNVYSENEIEKIISKIEKVTESKIKNASFRKSGDLFAIRKFHKEIPETLPTIFNHNLREIIKMNFGENYFITKSIYFDKPEKSNWFVAYHQDLTISVDKKATIENYENWTIKQNQFAVQPPKEILEQNFTIRIHIDQTTKENGALKVINKSNKKGIVRTENINFENETETICEVEKGGIMIMKPLLFHASSKTIGMERKNKFLIRMRSL
jgi:ectoine hydroxylase-related dioxygenase (phytanoyl-CoA dioxygenase family)